MIPKICPFCGGFICYSRDDNYNFCETCLFIIRSDGSGDYSEMDLDAMELDEGQIKNWKKQKMLKKQI